MMSQKQINEIANKFVFLAFYVAALCNLGFTICGSYIEQVLAPPDIYHTNFIHCTLKKGIF